MEFKKLLAEKLKEKGLDATEEMAEVLVAAVFQTGREIIKLSPTPLDNMMLPVVDLGEAAIMKLVDKIDGEVG